MRNRREGQILLTYSIIKKHMAVVMPGMKLLSLSGLVKEET
jgi:hypothetical protein